MPNVHMQTAAQNLTHAVADLRLLQQQVRADIEKQKRQLQDKISDRQKERVLVSSNAVNFDSDMAESVKATRIRNIGQEVKDMEKQIYSLEDEARKQIQSLENQAIQVEGISKQLQMMA